MTFFTRLIFSSRLHHGLFERWMVSGHASCSVVIAPSCLPRLILQVLSDRWEHILKLRQLLVHRRFIHGTSRLSHRFSMLVPCLSQIFLLTLSSSHGLIQLPITVFVFQARRMTISSFEQSLATMRHQIGCRVPRLGPNVDEIASRRCLPAISSRGNLAAILAQYWLQSAIWHWLIQGCLLRSRSRNGTCLVIQLVRRLMALMAHWIALESAWELISMGTSVVIRNNAIMFGPPCHRRLYVSIFGHRLALESTGSWWWKIWWRICCVWWRHSSSSRLSLRYALIWTVEGLWRSRTLRNCRSEYLICLQSNIALLWCRKLMSHCSLSTTCWNSIAMRFILGSLFKGILFGLPLLEG